MEQLSTYLSNNGISQRAFAKRVGIDQSVISRFARGEARPSLDVALNIEKETGGAVPCESWKIQGAA